MTTSTTNRRAAAQRDRVHGLLLDGFRMGDIQVEVGASVASLSKHLGILRKLGRVRLGRPNTDGVGEIEPGSGGLRVVVEEFGWVLAVPVPKQIEVKARGVHGDHDWLLLLVPDDGVVSRWVHMRGQRISQRIVSQMMPLNDPRRDYAGPVALALSCSTGLEAVLEVTD